MHEARMPQYMANKFTNFLTLGFAKVECESKHISKNRHLAGQSYLLLKHVNDSKYCPLVQYYTMNIKRTNLIKIANL